MQGINKDPQSNDANDNTNESSADQLPPVMEHDEPEVKTTVSTPVRNLSAQNKTPNMFEKKSAEAKTPTSIAGARPPMGEMHPSKVHQSTTKQADSGLILGFNPVKKDANGNVIKDSAIQDTPSKAKASPTSQYGTPGFEFKFACQESELSNEAKKLMESVRGDVAKVKTQMIQENKEHPSEDTRDGDRRIAKPKGRAGRFSNAHMAEFKKMDSIAGHASAFRATPGRFQPVNAASKTLKRTNSKARLDEPESQNNSPSKAPTVKASPAPVATGTKRVKHDKTDDASSRRPSSKDGATPKDGGAAPATTPRRVTQPRPRPTVRTSLMTPTKASMARNPSASVKPPKKPSMIPAPTRSPAGKTSMVPPRTPQTEFNPRLKTNLPSFANLKSILRRREPLFSKDPAKIAAGTHSAAPDFTPDLLLSGSPDKNDVAQTPSPKKRVDFSPSAKFPDDMPPVSPSPSKVPTAASSRPASDVTYPTLPALTPEKDASKPSIRQVRPSDVNENPEPLPEVLGVMHGINNKKRHRVEPENDKDTENMPPADSTTTDERSIKQVKLGSPVKTPQPPTPSPVKVRSSTPLRAGSVSRGGTPASVRKSRGFLTSSRLNMLAQPKNRS